MDKGEISKMRVVIKGAGDLATGIGYRLKKCGFLVVMTDLEVPTAVRRTVSFSRAIYEGKATVEDITAQYAKDFEQIEDILADGKIPVLVDPDAEVVKEWQPDIVVDAILAKKNLNTAITDAPLVIGVGPGFTAGTDCHRVVETKRGHYLGRVIEEGSAIPNTGIPGDIGGYTVERIIRSVADGVFRPVAQIGDLVQKGDLVAYSAKEPIYAQLTGIVRGMLQEGVTVTKGMKSGDIDPRCEKEHCFTISDKARSIGGGVLEAILSFEFSFSLGNDNSGK